MIAAQQAAAILSRVLEYLHMSLRRAALLGVSLQAIIAAPSFAQVTIDTATTEAVSTSTADNGAPADLEITSSGSIALEESPGVTAVTVDSSNSFTNDGSIEITNSNDVVGLRIRPGLSSTISGAGSISIVDDYEREDTDDDGDLDGPLATGSNRIGVLLEEGGALTGDVSLGFVSVIGNDSAGVSMRSALDGNFETLSTVVVVGSNTIAIDLREDLSGDLRVSGGVSAQGEGAVGVNVAGAVSGEFQINSSLTATGFTSTTISNYADPDELDEDDTPISERRDPDDLLNGGSALQIGNSLSRGLLINGAATGGTDPTDDEKDVVQDFNENRTTGSVSSYGSAPALLLSAPSGGGSDLVLGLVRESVRDTLDDDEDEDTSEIIGVFDYNYGLMNRGTISGVGVNIGFDATALRIEGAADGATSTIIAGGILNTGTITATAYEADAVAILLGSGSQAPQLVNSSAITATTYTEGQDASTGILIGAGAALPVLTNSGSITATVRGYDGSPTAIQDLSGTLTSFTNQSRISAGYIDDDAEDDVTSGLGRAVALDFRSGSGITVTQTDVVDNSRIYGDILLSSGDDTINLLSGLIQGDVEFGAGADRLNISSADYVGNLSFGGSSANIVLSSGANLYGTLELGVAAPIINVASGSVFEGIISGGTQTGGQLNVSDATFNNLTTESLQLDSLNLEAGAMVAIYVDAEDSSATQSRLLVDGAANIASDVVFTPRFYNFTREAFTVRVLEAGQLVLGGSIEDMLDDSTPFFFDLSLQSNEAENTIDLVGQIKTAESLGLNARQTNAYESVIDLVLTSDDAASALAAIDNAGGFQRTYSDLLPSQDATVLRVLASNATSGFGATARRLNLVSDAPDTSRGIWAEQFGVFQTIDSTAAANGVSTGGYGVALGMELAANRSGAFGLFGSLESVESEEHGRSFAPLNISNKSIGAYGGVRLGDLRLNSSASYGFLEFISNRQYELGGADQSGRAEWSGGVANANLSATYSVDAGRLSIHPFIAADYTVLNQDGYIEASTTDSPFSLNASESSSGLATGSAGARLTARWGDKASLEFAPELTLGYRSVLSYSAADAEYQFSGGSGVEVFTAGEDAEPEDAILAGVGLKLSNEFLDFVVGYDAEIGENSLTHYGSIALRAVF